MPKQPREIVPHIGVNLGQQLPQIGTAVLKQALHPQVGHEVAEHLEGVLHVLHVEQQHGCDEVHALDVAAFGGVDEGAEEVLEVLLPLVAGREAP